MLKNSSSVANGYEFIYNNATFYAQILYDSNSIVILLDCKVCTDLCGFELNFDSFLQSQGVSSFLLICIKLYLKCLKMKLLQIELQIILQLDLQYLIQCGSLGILCKHVIYIGIRLISTFYCKKKYISKIICS